LEPGAGCRVPGTGSRTTTNRSGTRRPAPGPRRRGPLGHFAKKVIPGDFIIMG